MAIQTWERAPDERLQLRPILNLTRAVAAAGRTEEIYDAALECLRETIGIEQSSILRFDAEGVMRFSAWRNLSAAYMSTVEGHSPWSQDTRDPEPVLVSDVTAEPSLAGFLSAFEAEGIRSLAFVPLTLRGVLMGKFMLYRDQPHDFAPGEIEIAQAIAAHIALAIDQSENRRQRGVLDTIFHTSATGIGEIDSDGRFRVVNDRFCEIVGRSREELQRLTTYDITHPDDVQITHDTLAAMALGASNVVVEKRYLKPDGSVVWVSKNVSAIRDEFGVVVGAIDVVTDVTQRRQAELHSVEMGRRYQSLVEALALAVYTTDEQGHITSYNDAAVRMWGRKPERFQEQWCGAWRIFDADGEPLAFDESPMAITLKEGRPVRDVEMRIERPDGSMAHVLPYPTPLFMPDGTLVGGVNVLVDITERKQAELDLTARTQMTEAITNNMSAGLIMVGRTGLIEYVNPAAEKISGYTFEQLKGQNVHSALHHTRPDGTPYPSRECPITLGSRAGNPVSDHYDVFVRPDGTFYDVVCSIATLPGLDGTLGAVLDLRDVTAEKQAERALRESEENLRTAAALKDQFLGLISHELRTPIATIFGNGLLLQRRGDALRPEDRQQALTDIVGEATKLQEIIENLLLLTRLEAGLIELEPVVLSRVAQDAITEFQRHAPERQVIYHSDDGIPLAQGQLTLIQLVLRNFLSNADKYSPSDSPIEVELHVNEDGDPEVSVRDHGIGLSPADLQNVFAPFFRTPEARDRAQGMGLGLAVCKRVIDAQGGSIYARSGAGEGSRFVFTLQALRT